jgi:2OG-Fe(II) oxygenase superfamily
MNYDKINIFKNAVSEENIQTLLEHTRHLLSEDNTIYFAKPAENGRVRKTPMGKGNGIYYSLLVHEALKSMGLEHSDSILSRTQLLHYPVGAFNGKHADNCTIDPKTGKVTVIKPWTHSAVIYLNDDYEGGELVYPDLNFTYKPIKGSAIIHPAGASHIHYVNPVTKGDRYCVVLRLKLPKEDVVVNNAT